MIALAYLFGVISGVVVMFVIALCLSSKGEPKCPDDLQS